MFDEHEGAHARVREGAVSRALEVMRASGHGVTAPRRAVVELLSRRADHLRADEIAELLAHREPAVHRATVYRALDLLVQLGLVSSLNAEGGAAAYHLAVASTEAEHLHARCRVCGTIVLLRPSVFSSATEATLAHTGFRLEPARLTLTGVCAACADRAAALRAEENAVSADADGCARRGRGAGPGADRGGC